MSTNVEIGLSQLVLWYDAPRIQTWPELLSRIPEDTVLPSPTDFGRRFDTKRMTDHRHAAAEKIVRNLPGLEKQRNRLLLKGVGLLAKDVPGYFLSTQAHELRKAYIGDPKGKDWVRVLGRLLLANEPRTRVLIRALSQPDAALVFDGDAWFAGSIRKAYIETQAGPIYGFVGDHPSAPCLRTLLREHSWWALGAWRQDALLLGAENCVFTGTLQRELSLHDVSLALRGAFELLLYLGMLDASGQYCRLDTALCAREFGSDLAADFGWTDKSAAEDVERLLARLIKDLQSDTGYVVASELRKELRRQGISNPDAEIARLQAEDRLVIEAEEYGQARHGEGLFGDPRKQMIQIRLSRSQYEH